MEIGEHFKRNVFYLHEIPRSDSLARVAGGISKVGSTAVICRVGFADVGIELMLTDQQAEAITQARLAVWWALLFAAEADLCAASGGSWSLER